MHLLQVTALLTVSLASYSTAAPTSEPATNTLAKRLEDGQYLPDSGGTYKGTEGHRVGSVDETSDPIRQAKCWTDYMIVSQETAFDDFKDASGEIDCASTSECSSETATGVQTCETWQTSNAGIQDKIFGFGVSAGYSLQECHTSSDARTCTWDDKQCHKVTTSQEVLVQTGYERYRCKSHKTSVTTPDQTIWLKDFVHRVPTNFAKLSCNNSC